MSDTIDTGDIVLHKPTGEEWVVAFVEGRHLYPCGWPLTREPAAFCELQIKADAEARLRLLRDMAKLFQSDPRGIYARDRLRREGFPLTAEEESNG